jgi:hypothetical protein
MLFVEYFLWGLAPEILNYMLIYNLSHLNVAKDKSVNLALVQPNSFDDLTDKDEEHRNK